jgi:hypothetical protein
MRLNPLTSTAPYVLDWSTLDLPIGAMTRRRIVQQWDQGVLVADSEFCSGL